MIKNPVTLSILTLAALLVASPTLAQDAETVPVDEVVVSATGVPTPIDQLGVSVDVITAEDIEAAQFVFLKDALTGSAGVSSYQSGGPGTLSNVFMRGLTGKYVGLSIDGINMFDPVADQVIWEDLDVTGLSRVEVLRGSNSVVYGSSAIGGVISAYTDIGGAAESTVALERGEFGTSNLTANTKGAAGAFAYGVSGRSYRTDGISAADEVDGNTETDAYENDTFNGRFAYELTDNIALDFAARSAEGVSAYDSRAPADADNIRDFQRSAHRVGVKAEQGALSHSLFQTVFDNKTFDVTGFGLSSRESGREEIGYDVSADLQGLRISYGFRRTDDSYDVSGTVYESQNIADFVIGQFGVADQLFVNLALRQDDHEDFGGALTYRLSGRLALAEAFAVRGAYATGFKAPSLYQLNDPAYGNTELEPEESESREIGFDVTPATGVSVSLTLFAIDIDNLIGYDPATFQSVQTIGTTKTMGGELGFGLAIDRVSLEANYSYTDNEKPDGSRDVRRPRHMLNAQVNFAANDKFGLNLGVRIVSDTTDTDFATSTEVELDDYSLVRVGARYRVTDAFEAYGRVENALDDDYQTALGYGTPGRAAYVGVKTRF